MNSNYLRLLGGHSPLGSAFVNAAIGCAAPGEHRPATSKNSTHQPAASAARKEQTMPGIQDLREKRAEKSRELRALTDKHKDSWSAAHGRQSDKLIAEIDALDDQITKFQAVLDRTADELARGEGRGAVRSGSLFEAKNAAREYFLSGDASGFGYRNAMTEGGNGAVLVPGEIRSEILKVVIRWSPLRGFVRVLTTETNPGEVVQPIITSGAVASWGNETSARNETTAPTVGSIRFEPCTLYGLIPLGEWLREDTAIEDIVIEEIGAAFGRAEGTAIVRGSGTGQPKGLLVMPTAAEPDEDRDFGTLEHSVSSAVTSDALISMVYKLAPQYRQGAVWTMTASTISLVRSLKDTSDRYLWTDSIAPGEPAMLLGFPVVECPDWDEIGVGKCPVGFGNMWNAYTLVDRSMSFMRDPYSQKPFTIIYGRKRTSGSPCDTAALKLLKIGS